MKHPAFDQHVFLLQGGGALGAYQVGVFKGLQESGYEPNWMIGTSIGAINSAIIAGNEPKDRIKKLEMFWQTIATDLLDQAYSLNNILLQRWQNFLSAQITSTLGQPGFFKPREENPWLGINSTPDQLSYYDTSPLLETLRELINFDLINAQRVRLSIGAVQVDTGKLVYFDNTKMPILPEHLMASSALPPGFPAIRIGNHYYWDGGVHSNTHINLMLQETLSPRTLCFMVHLFTSDGELPTNMDDVLKRQKEITYSSHHKESIQIFHKVHKLGCAIRILSQYLDEQTKQTPEIKKILELSQTGVYHIARFHCQSEKTELSSRDYEFSLASIQKHLDSGLQDVMKMIDNPPWYQPIPNQQGLIVHEITDLEVETII